MKKITSLIAIIFYGILFSQTYSTPESVEYDYANSRWFIGNAGSGEIIERDNSGNLSVFVDDVGSGPHGIEIMGDVLYACSGGSIKGFSLSTGDEVFNLNLGGSFLNGLTHDNSGNLYATDFSAKSIYKIEVATETFTEIATSLGQTPNGIVFDEENNRCIFVNWGLNAPIKAIDLTSFEVTTLLSTNHGNCDGISKDGAGNYYVSVWNSQSVVKYDNAFADSPVTVVNGLSSPADIFVNTEDNILGIPNSGNNTVTFFELPDMGIHSVENKLNDIRVYPNPISDIATLSLGLHNFKSISAEIKNAEGKTVKIIDCKSDSSIQNNIEFDISNLSLGIYYLVVKADTEIKTIPILKK